MQETQGKLAAGLLVGELKIFHAFRFDVVYDDAAAAAAAVSGHLGLFVYSASRERSCPSTPSRALAVSKMTYHSDTRMVKESRCPNPFFFRGKERKGHGLADHMQKHAAH
jgi:hypothetical protein